MSLVRSLAEELLERHSEQAAAVLERLPTADSAEILQGSGPERGGALLRRLSPPAARDALLSLPPEKAGPMLDSLALPTVAALLRMLDPERRDAILDAMDRDRVRGVAAILRHAPGTAAAHMDPLTLALAQDATAEEALALVREHAENARYNLYVVDRERRLVGVLNLRELLMAAPRAPLSDVMLREPLSIRAAADRSAVLSHPGWRRVHSLPVVDDDGVYLGSIRYRTLRRLEDEVHAVRRHDDDAAGALGALFAAGAGGLLEALAGATQTTGAHHDGSQ